MLGKISISNPNQFSLDPSRYSNARFKIGHERAFRSIYIDSAKSQIFQMGTVLYRKTTLDATQSNSPLHEIFASKTFSELDGLFLLIYYNKNTSTLTILNNNYQLTKLYYCIINDHLIFSHQLELLLPELERIEPNFSSIKNFLQNGFNLSEKTQVMGVSKLLPSQYIHLCPNGLQIKDQWDKHYIVNRTPFTDLDSMLDKYESIYQQTLKTYLDARAPQQLGTLLSGGHDTSFLLIQASKVYEKPIHCFTTVFSEWSFSEKSHAENTCNKFGGIFHPKEFSASDLDLIIDLINSCEEPVLGSSLPLHALAKYAGQYTDTLMGGDGGDTLWGEYHPVGEFHRWVHRWPTSWRILAHKISLYLRNLTDWERFWELEHVAGLFATDNYYKDFLSNLCTYRHFSRDDINNLTTKKIREAPIGKSSLEIIFNCSNFDEALIEGKLFNGFYTYQSFQQTRSMNAFGMEFFLPTVQKDILDFINSLPMNWLNGGTTFHRLINSKSTNRKFHKYALARYMKKEEIYNRSFDIPWHLIWENRRQTLHSLRKALKQRDWYHPASIDQIFDEFLAQKNKDHELLELKSHGYRIMTLLALEVWAKIYLDGGYKSGIDTKTTLDDLFD